jgi:hypothetical protein
MRVNVQRSTPWLLTPSPFKAISMRLWAASPSPSRQWASIRTMFAACALNAVQPVVGPPQKQTAFPGVPIRRSLSWVHPGEHARVPAIMGSVDESGTPSFIEHVWTARERETQLTRLERLCSRMADLFAVNSNPRASELFRTRADMAHRLLAEGYAQVDLNELGGSFPAGVHWLHPKSPDYNAPRAPWQEEVGRQPARPRRGHRTRHSLHCPTGSGLASRQPPPGSGILTRHPVPRCEALGHPRRGGTTRKTRTDCSVISQLSRASRDGIFRVLGPTSPTRGARRCEASVGRMVVIVEIL